MSLHKSRWATVCSLLAVAFFGSMVVTEASAGKGGKGNGGGGGGGGSTLPVMYEIQFIEGMKTLSDRNNSGMAVGSYLVEGEDRGCLYSPSIDPSRAIDLNDTVDGIPIVAGIPEGWVIAHAVGINELGDIVGKLRQPGAARNTNRGFVIDMNVTDENGDLVIDEYGDPVPPQLYELPDAPFESPNTYGSRINDNGDILGKIFMNDGTPMLAYLYNPGLDGQQIVGPTDLRVFNSAFQFNYTGIQINNPDPEAGRDLQIAGSLQSPSGESVAFRYTLGGALDVLDPFEDANGNMIRLSTVGDINESGTVFGNAEVLFPKKIKGRTSTSALYRFGTTEEMFDWKYRESATAINDAGDFVASGDRLYLEGIGFVNIIDLIDNSDSDAELFSQSSFRFKLLTNPTGTGFPMILGEAWPNTVNRTMFLLTPVAVPQ